MSSLAAAGALPSMLAGAALTGLLATPHCAAMCGGFATACSSHRGRDGRSAFPWHLGRLAGYAVLGALAGGAGRALPGPAWLPALLAALLLLWSAAALAGLVGDPARALPAAVRPVATLAAALARRPGVVARVGFGAAIALLPCGMLWAALGAAVASGGPGTGALVMAAFGVGTLPGLVVVAAGLRRLAGASLVRRRIVAAAVLAAGLVVIGARWRHAAAAITPASPHAHY